MSIAPDRSEGHSCGFCARFVPSLYGMTRSGALRSLLRSVVLRFEKGGAESRTIRELFRRYHGVEVGLYTVGPCHVKPGNLPPGTAVGRYSSIYYTVRALTHDRPRNSRDPHALYGEDALGEPNPAGETEARLRIGNDVFIGHNAIVLPEVREIGDGAVIGAGSVVQTSVPAYAVVTGNPARVVRFRFSKPKIEELLESKWWLKSLSELGPSIDEFRVPLEGGPLR